MIKKVTNRFSFLLGVSLLLLCAVALFPIKAKAVETEREKMPEWPESWDSVSYELGEEEDTSIQPNFLLQYFFEAPFEGNVRYFVTFKSYGEDIGELVFENAPMNEDDLRFITKKDFKRQYDKKNKVYTYTTNITLDTEEDLGFNVINYSESTYRYTFTITAEPEIVLDKTAISEITNTKSHTMTVKYAPVKKRLGYQIEYADNSKFNNKARVNTGATTKNIGKLTIGKYYYVRVRVYARYDNGTLVYSKWSGTRKVKIKK